MATLPSSLALTSIADGSPIIAADHRNNYAAVQTEANGLLTILGAGVTGQVLKGNGTTVTWDYPPGYEIGYAQITANVNIASTTEATGTTIISPGAITFDGTPVYAEFFGHVLCDTNATGDVVVVSLFEGATQIGRLSVVVTPLTANQFSVPTIGRFKFTPTAAAHTYTVTAFATSTTGTPAVSAGAAGTGVKVPAYVRFVKV